MPDKMKATPNVEAITLQRASTPAMSKPNPIEADITPPVIADIAPVLKPVSGRATTFFILSSKPVGSVLT
ncbi:MAG: hypothetical protein LBD03_02385 [Methanobrevibacter sp.]|jgi:hypothetical protein|nr:hypothetical protein [Candidatus Methanovirga procula]